MTKKSLAIRCTECGAWLDPGEQCDCERRETETRKDKRLHATHKKMAQNAETYEKGWEEYLYA